MTMRSRIVGRSGSDATIITAPSNRRSCASSARVGPSTGSRVGRTGHHRKRTVTFWRWSEHSRRLRSPPEGDVEPMNLAVWVERHGRLRPEGAALADGERVHATWAELAARVARAAAGLRDGVDLSPGGRVAIVLRNRPEYLEALFAVWHAGLVAVPVNARLHRDEIGYIVDDSGAAVVLTDADHADDVEALGVASVLVPGARWDRLTATTPAALV